MGKIPKFNNVHNVRSIKFIFSSGALEMLFAYEKNYMYVENSTMFVAKYFQSF